jgi:hypothetical protein
LEFVVVQVELLEGNTRAERGQVDGSKLVLMKMKLL